MKHVFFCRAFQFGVLFFCLKAVAQSSFTLTNSNDASTQIFTNSLGTAVLTNGLIVFEGRLDATMPVVAAVSAGKLLASVQLLAQIKLFDELPSSNEVGAVQGAVAALRDQAVPTTGKVYARGSTNSVME